ncbi:MAG: NAD(P)H-hydrate epimerase [Planctomycetota bacterium]
MNRAFTRADARAYDRHCMEELGIPGVVLMERAAAGCSAVARELLGGRAAARVVVCCGSGQNGGDGYEVARLLARDGHAVRIVALGAPREGTDAAVMRARAVEAGLRVEPYAPEALGGPADLVVDALFGTGLDRPLAGDARAAVEAINRLRDSGAKVLAIDLPSGLDCDSGAELPVCVRADATATMVAPKAGFRRGGPEGRVVVVDLGGPEPAVRP